MGARLFFVCDSRAMVGLQLRPIVGERLQATYISRMLPCGHGRPTPDAAAIHATQPCGQPEGRFEIASLEDDECRLRRWRALAPSTAT